MIAAEKFPLELEARRRVKEAFVAHGIRGPARPRVRLAARPAPPSGESGRKESVA